MDRLRARLTYANVMATVAVFIALGGSSYAAIKVTGKNVKNSSLTGADIKKNSVTGTDIKGLGPGDFKKGTLRTGPTGATGQQGATGAPGSALAYGRVAADGTATLTKNATVTAGGGAAGSYCIDVPQGTPRNITATLTTPFTIGAFAVVGIGTNPACSATTDATVSTRDSGGTIDPQPFFFTVN